MTREYAKNMVLKFLYSDAVWADIIKPTVLDEFTIEKNFGWVFFYQSYEFVINKDNPLSGNAPLIVDKDYNVIVETGTSEDINFYIELYEKSRGNDIIPFGRSFPVWVSVPDHQNVIPPEGSG